MKYTFEQEPLTCITLENELGLNRGDIASLTVYPERAVEVETKVDLTTTAQANLKAALAKKNLPRGKKSVI